jgi:hypothetical protein
MASSATGSPTAQATKPQEVVDALLYGDVSSMAVKKMLFDFKGWAVDTDFAEDFLDKGGLDALLKLVRTTTGAVQSLILQAVRALLVYLNALERFAESPELVDRIYHLLSPPEPGAPVNLAVAKAALEVLVVVCGKLDNGHQYINDAAKRKIGVDNLPYGVLGPLLGSNDLNCVTSTLLLMNLLIAKRKAVNELKGKRLFFKWQQAGLLSLLKPLETIEDPGVKKQLSALQKATGYTIPRSWVEAHKFKTQYQDIKRRYDQANEQLFVLQQQQAKVRLLKQEFTRAQITLRALGALMPSVSTVQHPVKRFSEGGGIALSQLVHPDTEPLDIDAAAMKDTSDLQKKLLESLLKQPDLAAIAETIIVPDVKKRGGFGARHGDPYASLYMTDDAAFPPPPDDDDDDDLPPPDDDDEDLPPPDDDDDDAPPVAGTAPKHSGGVPGQLKAGGAGGAPTGGSSGGPSGPLLPTAVPPPSSGGTPFGEGQVAAAVVAGRLPGGPPPPPPPPPPPRFGKGPLGPPGSGPSTGPSKSYYKGPAPTKKMRPLHWDKWALDDAQEKSSFWGAVHAGTIDCEFDYAEFEAMFCQKEIEKKEKAKKVEKILLVDSKTYQNLSIMLHKLPTIPTIQNALLTLDGAILEPQMLLSMTDPKLLTAEVFKTFLQKQNDKPMEEYEPPEQFIAMAISVPEFQRRCAAWLFTLEWDDNVASAMKPIKRMNDAMQATINSKYLPVYLGMLLAFGNMMNHGNAQKGNAPAISLNALSKLEASKDNRGKVSLLQHLLDTVKKRQPDALELHEEMKPIFDGVGALKIDDLEKSISEAEKSLNVFRKDCTMVRKAIEEAGSAAEDPFIPYTAEFLARATQSLDQLKVLFAEAQKSADALQQHLGVPAKKPMKPEEIFAELIPFTDKVRAAAADAARDRKRLSRKGQKLDTDLNNVVGALQEQVVSAGL